MSLIRPLRTEETLELLHLRRRLFIHEVERSGIPTENAQKHIEGWAANSDSIAKIEGYRDNTDEYYLRVVEHAGNLAGLFLAGLRPEGLPDDATQVRLVHLDATLQGQGIGKELMNDFFEEYGDRDNYLDVLQGNYSAIGFYAAQGYISTGASREVFIGGHQAVYNQMYRPAA